ADPTKTGYTFAGWFNGAAAYDFSTILTGDITLTAHWTAVISVAPGITGPMTLTLAKSYTATSTGVYTITGTAPVTVAKTSGDAKITWDSGTMKLNIAAGLPVGTYVVVLTASNGTSPDATLTFTLTVQPGNSGTAVVISSVSVSPSTANVKTGSTQQFSASVKVSSGNPSKDVIWSISGNNNAGTTISSTGLLTIAAGETSTTIIVKATSLVDPAKSGTSSVSVSPASGNAGGKKLPDQIMVITSGDPASFVIDVPLSEFLYLSYNDSILPGENYVLTSGSTIITFTESYLNSLAPGTYVYNAVFNSGTANLTLTVEPAGAGPDNVSDSSNDSNVVLWVAIAVAAVLIVAGLAVAVSRRAKA
ncbi:MAG: InlB B-repeat-containing protein, partial [Candidatus Methanoplasma sp.]|nr:InlB B-repeat-containing protein [Candidatus Methanoplasma sp.]